MGWPSCWPTGIRTSFTGLVLVGAACTPDSVDGFDRLLALPVVGEALTVAGLLTLGEVLPKVRRLAPRVPAVYRDPSGPRCPTRACSAASGAPSVATVDRS